MQDICCLLGALSGLTCLIGVTAWDKEGSLKNAAKELCPHELASDSRIDTGKLRLSSSAHSQATGTNRPAYREACSSDAGTSSKNYGDASDSEVDRLLEEQSAMMDEAKRKEIVLKLQRVIIDKQPFVHMYWANNVMAWWPEVKDFTRPLAQYAYWRMEEVWLGR